MRLLLLCISLGMALMVFTLPAEVVINELLYDPTGTDTGYEWLELYNNGEASVDLEGAVLQAGGAEFTTIYTFPHFVLRPDRFVLIGEANITQAALITPLAMQNGGAETDGVRYISPDGSYTDTVLYDEPNANQLPADSGEPGTQWAIDVPTGCSLARRVDGLDTDDSSADFICQSNPSPGLSNPTDNAVDYALADCAIDLAATPPVFSTNIVNNSVLDIDNLTVTLNFSFEGENTQSFDIQPIETGSFVCFSTPLNLPDNPQGVFHATLDCDQDFNTINNVWEYTFGSGMQPGVYLNEILYNPNTDNQEWIELCNAGTAQSGFTITIEDASENHVNVDIPPYPETYLVLCRDKEQLLVRYPDCPAEAVLEVNSLPALNNEGDVLYLKDSLGVVVDSMAYVGVASKKDFSLERQVENDSTVSWHYCYSSAQGTPGQANSTAPPPPPIPTGSIRIVNSPFNPLSGETAKIQYNFIDEANAISCAVYDLKGNKRYVIAESQPVNQSGEITWDGKDKAGRALPRGIYILRTEAKNSSGRYFLQKQQTIVLATK